MIWSRLKIVAVLTLAAPFVWEVFLSFGPVFLDRKLSDGEPNKDFIATPRTDRQDSGPFRATNEDGIVGLNSDAHYPTAARPYAQPLPKGFASPDRTKIDDLNAAAKDRPLAREIENGIDSSSDKPVTAPNTTDGNAEGSDILVAKPTTSVIGVFENEKFNICGYKDFTIRVVSGRDQTQGFVLASPDRSIPDKGFTGYEKRLPLRSPVRLWDGCIVAVGYDGTVGVTRIVVSIVNRRDA